MQIIMLIAPFAPRLLCADSELIREEIRRLCRSLGEETIYAPTLKLALERALTDKKFLFKMKAENILTNRSPTVFDQTVYPSQLM